MDRFYSPELPISAGQTVDLSPDEAHHAARVLRKAEGDRVILFDGAGRAVEATLTSVRKKGVSAEITKPIESADAGSIELVLATAVPKADRFKWMVEKATELGVSRVIPLICERSVVHPGGSKLEKMRSVVVSACKQCERNRLMRLDEPMSFADVLNLAAEQRYLADLPADERIATQPPAAERATASPGEQAVAHAGGSVLIAVGPEGGWTDAERGAAYESGMQRLSVGRHVLRVETAAIAAAARFVE